MRAFATLMLGLFFIAPAVSAQLPGSSADQDVTIVIEDVEAITVTPSALTLTLNTPGTVGDSLEVTDASTIYAITVNTAGNKITGELNAAYTSGVVLYATLDAPAAATSTGQQALTAVAKDLVSGVANVQEDNLTISYTAKAPATALSNPGELRTVTYTITNE